MSSPRPGKPLGGENEIAAVMNTVEKDARYAIEDIAELTGINSSAVFRILHKR